MAAAAPAKTSVSAEAALAVRDGGWKADPKTISRLRHKINPNSLRGRPGKRTTPRGMRCAGRSPLTTPRPRRRPRLRQAASVTRTPRGYEASFGPLPVGVFASEELAWRSLDILRLKSGRDAGLPLASIALRLPLEVRRAPTAAAAGFPLLFPPREGVRMLLALSL